MRVELVIEIAGQPGFRLPLKPGVSHVGSAPECDVRIRHEEVAASAVVLDFRESACRVSNLNPYPIFVGDAVVTPAHSARWRPNEILRLTRSVQLQLVKSAARPAAKPGQSVPAGATVREVPRKNRRTTMALGAILAIALVALLCPSGSGSADGTRAFSALCRDLHRDSAAQSRALLPLVQAAWRLEHRSSKPGEPAVVEAYRRLLEQDDVQRADPAGASMASRVKRFATLRLRQLNSG